MSCWSPEQGKAPLDELLPAGAKDRASGRAAACSRGGWRGAPGGAQRGRDGLDPPAGGEYRGGGGVTHAGAGADLIVSGNGFGRRLRGVRAKLLASRPDRLIG